MRVMALLLLSGLAVLAAGDGPMPSAWAVAPFVVLLLGIALLPLVKPAFWHHWYPAIAIGLGAVTAGYYLIGLQSPGPIVHAGFEYAAFITLIGCLFLCSAGVVLRLGFQGTPSTNVAFLAIGAVAANLVGTTGAAMLLIRPWLRLNDGRLRPYHVVFFIFLVANVGGALTPIGDPPLLLGFLRGIPFWRFAELNWAPWLLATGALLAIFWAFDRRNAAVAVAPPPGPRLRLAGWRNLGLLALALPCLFLDPGILPWLPAIAYHGERFSFLREVLLLGIGVTAWLITPRERHAANRAELEPLREVGLLFIGIFLTMVPALDLIRAAARGGSIAGLPLDPSLFYLGTGVFSAMLDNAPTFVAFLAGIEGRFGLTTQGIGASADPMVAHCLGAAACASVFWGAMTYIGNGPNFMVKAIVAETRDRDGKVVVPPPDFFAFVWRYSLPILLPVLLLVWVLFYR